MSGCHPRIDPACGELAAADTGLRPASGNRRLDDLQLEWSRRERRALLRLHRSHPSAWIGAHEHERHAVRADYCRARGIPILRRLTGGEACYRDPQQWNLTLTVPLAAGGAGAYLAPWPALAGRALRTALHGLGFTVGGAHPGRIELGGRTLGEVFVAIHGDVAVVEAHLFRAVDTEALLRVLRVPKEKLTPEGVRSVRRRYAALDEDGGHAPAPAVLNDAVHRALAVALGLPAVDLAWPVVRRGTGDARPGPPPGEDGGAYTGFVKTDGGVLYGALRPDADGTAIETLSVHGDVQLHPHSLLSRWCEALAACPLEEALERTVAFLAAEPHEFLGFRDEDLLRVLRVLLGRRVLQARLGLSAGESGALMIHDPAGDADTPAVLARAQVLLVPYCAKPTWCRWRHRDGCPECGRCSVGTAYRLGRTRGMRVVTIRNFEHLEQTLGRLRADGVGAYVGLCCRNFFLKREYAFRAAGLPAVLLDITGSNCYELQQEELAYAGRFEAQAELDLPVLEKVMAAVPACGAPIPARGGARRQTTPTDPMSPE